MQAVVAYARTLANQRIDHRVVPLAPTAILLAGLLCACSSASAEMRVVSALDSSWHDSESDLKRCGAETVRP